MVIKQSITQTSSILLNHFFSIFFTIMYLKINKNLLRPSNTASLVADTSKAKKTFNFKVERNLESIISIMMENDLKLEMAKK